ncbi:sulfatase-like hydrolase/transferase, partial [bacterium]|nr:sulfatase-like hydrolase/transferase [bacterium]
MSANFYMYLSLFLFVAGVYLYRKTGFAAKNMVFYTMVFASVILYSIFGMSDYFTGNGIDESTIFHFKYGLGGAGFSEYLELIVTSVVLIILGTIFVVWILSKRVKSNSRLLVNNYTAHILVLVSLLLNPATADLYSHLSYQSSTAVANKLYKEPFITKPTTNDFNKFYREPYITKVMGETKNLVVIYAESLERTYFDETIFPGLIKGLRKLESKSTYFTNIKQVAGTRWTIGGMVASQCGIPLFTPSHGNSMSGMDEFLPSAICLGDLLHNEGYELIYYGGADLAFAGKGKFYASHGFDEISGKDELLADLADESYKSGWGLFDDSLFDLAYKRFVELSALDDKFGLFLLTLDTHHPKGHLSKSCQGKIYDDGLNPMLNAVACSDYLITEFINEIMQSPYGEKTVVVLLSDHLAMRNTASNLLKKSERRNLFMIIEANANRSTEIQELGSPLDIGATVLPFIGYNGSIGLGRNLNDTNQSIAEIEYIQKNLLAWKSSVSQFWDFPKIRDFVEIDITAKTLKIDDRVFDIPVLIELNADLETTLKFQFHRSGGHKKLIDHLLMLDNNRAFILIDECANVNELDEELGQTGFCLIAGNGDKYVKKTRLYGNVTLASDDIRGFIELIPNFQPLRVAHAGGGIRGKTYTNSLDALDQNIENGFLYFELDFSFTKDGRLVCIHDWKKSFRRSFGFWTKEKPTVEAFE